MSRTCSSGNRFNRTSAVVTAVPITLSAWIFSTSLTASNGVLAICSVTSTSGVYLYLAPSGAVIAEHIQTGTGTATTTATATTNAWFHVAGVFTSTTSRAAYLSGANKATNATTTSAISAANTLIGSVWQASYFDAVGSIAFAGIWNIALSDTDIASLGAGASPLKVRPDALKSYAPLVSGASPEPDLIASSYPLVGTPTLNASNPRIYTPF